MLGTGACGEEKKTLRKVFLQCRVCLRKLLEKKLENNAMLSTKERFPLCRETEKKIIWPRHAQRNLSSNGVENAYLEGLLRDLSLSEANKAKQSDDNDSLMHLVRCEDWKKK
jgi:hypothetical protein